MGQKINPVSFRIGINRGWVSRWFGKKNIGRFLEEDHELRSLIAKRFAKAGIERVEIERSPNHIRVILFTSRPGLIIGRGGEGVEALKKDIERKILKMRDQKNAKLQVKVDIEEVRRAETNATLVAQSMADQIEKRIRFRRILKQAIEKVMSNKDVLGVKVMVKGRLDGSEMARTEWLKRGKIPLHTLRANIDYAAVTAFNTYGTVGVKVWIYKGDVFEDKDKRSV
ncbi:30S ribosomal protein S3 [Candidatus Parcubacteria bacterium]|nr:MAG: 30S ribosomal protein S3 [Candidatus Parcubacteria bacterium]